MSEKKLIEKLLEYAKLYFNLSVFDVNYMRNVLLNAFKLSAPQTEKLSEEEIEHIKSMTLPDELFGECVAFAMNNFQYDINQAELFASYVFGLISPLPSKVNDRFITLRENTGAKAACKYLHDLCVMNNYVQVTKLSKNIFWDYKKGKNHIELTINHAKPEKNNKDIAKLLTQKVTDIYPKCQLCRENVGYYGGENYPPRANLRTVDITLNKEKWFMQYSPFAYVNEHAVLISDEHKPMKVDGDMVDLLFDFIEYIPDYFVASNSDLPIVGGSILNHRHFQCGKKIMPLFEAKAVRELKCADYPDVEIALTDWYCTNLRLSGYNRNTIKEIFSRVIDSWLSFSDDKNVIINGEGENRHNSATVVARYLENGKYTIDIVLRNNATNEKYPHGIYHVPPIYHNIKKEGLGLMEVMGVFILPSRLDNEIFEISNILCNKKFDLSELDNQENKLYPHRFMVKGILDKQGYFKDPKKAETAIRDYIGEACIKMIEIAGVYGKDNASVLSFLTFLSKLNIK